MVKVHGGWGSYWGCAAGVPSLYMYKGLSVCSFLWFVSCRGEVGREGGGVFKVLTSPLKSALRGWWFVCLCVSTTLVVVQVARG